MKAGDTVEVIDVTAPRTAKGKLPFALGATFRIAKLWPGGNIQLAGIPGIWSGFRFKVVGRG